MIGYDNNILNQRKIMYFDEKTFEHQLSIFEPTLAQYLSYLAMFIPHIKDIKAHLIQTGLT